MKKPFNVVMLSRDRKQHEALSRILERSCRIFHWALSVDEVVSYAKQKSISVLLLAESQLQDSQVAYFQLIKSYPEIEQQLTSTMLICAKAESRQAYQLCRKKIFTDYFVGNPLYDPYHILLRLNEIKRGQDKGVPLNRVQTSSLTEVVECLEHFSDAEKQVNSLNEDLVRRLGETISNAITLLNDKLAHLEAFKDGGAQQLGQAMSQYSRELVTEPLQAEVRRTTRQVGLLMHDVSEAAEAQCASIAKSHPEIAERIKHFHLIEDNRDVRTSIETFLLNRHYEVVSYSHGTQFLRALPDITPDCILLDLSLPDISALHVIQRIQQAPHLSQVPIVALASKGDRDEIKVAMQMGVREIMMKPLDEQMLVFRINAIRTGAAQGAMDYTAEPEVAMATVEP